MTWQVAAHVTQPGEFIVKHLVIDDAVYYAVPARHFVEGHGYSFDGIHRTNGVQPLWALVTTCLAAFVKDDVTLLRCFSALSGMLWLCAAVSLYRFLNQIGALATLAATGFLAAGLEMRLGLCGMENGLQALLLALLLMSWRRLEQAHPSDTEWRRRALDCGLILAALCLNRIEFPVLALPFGLRAAAIRRKREPWGRTALSLRPLVIPPILAVTAWCITSKLYFGDWVPVSGLVKAHMTANTPQIPGFVESYWHHVNQVLALSFVPELITVMSWGNYFATLSTAVAATVTLGALCLPATTAALSAVRNWGSNTIGSHAWPVALLGCAAAIHIGLVSKYMAIFTSYCTWYFAVDIFAAWAGLGYALGASRGRTRLLICIPCVAIILATGARKLILEGVPPEYPISATGIYVEAGRTAQRMLPPGRTIGAFNAGFISLHARSHTVVNLDGLMNDGDYLRNYFAKNRVDEYIREQHIEYLVDSLPVALWQSYEAGNGARLPKPLEPLHCELNDGWFVTCVIATPEAKNQQAPIAVRNPLAQIHWDAIVNQKLKLVRHQDLASLSADQQVISTLLEPGTRQPLHVVGDRRIAITCIDSRSVAQLPPTNAAFEGKVTLLAAQIHPGPHPRNSTAMVRTYWRADNLASSDDLELGLVSGTRGVGAGEDAQWIKPAFGTLPPTEWARGSVIAQTFLVTIPAHSSNPIDVAISVRNSGGNPLQASQGSEKVAIGRIEVL